MVDSTEKISILMEFLIMAWTDRRGIVIMVGTTCGESRVQGVGFVVFSFSSYAFLSMWIASLFGLREFLSLRTKKAKKYFPLL